MSVPGNTVVPNTTRGETTNFAGPVTAANCDVAYAAVTASGALPAGVHVIERVWGGYDATPTGGLLQIIGGSDGATIVAEGPITQSGLFFMDVNIRSYPGQALKARLTSGGGAVNGYLNVKYRLEQ